MALYSAGILRELYNGWGAPTGVPPPRRAATTAPSRPHAVFIAAPRRVWPLGEERGVSGGGGEPLAAPTCGAASRASGASEKKVWPRDFFRESLLQRSELSEIGFFFFFFSPPKFFFAGDQKKKKIQNQIIIIREGGWVGRNY